MATLYSTACSIDWKGRPTHALTILGTSSRAELLRKMDEDIAAWQARDIVADQEIENDEAKDEDRPARTVPSTWEQPGERWEMTRDNQDKPRVFVWRFDDGGFWSLAYHIID